MREILFRAKRLTDQKWTYGDFTEVVGDCPRILSNEDVTMYAVIPETVGQYTGLIDKNGKKIFEGDILGLDCEAFKGVHTVVDRDEELETIVTTYNVIVIGNIHDNHELLEGGE